ncbi:hypothetical protein FACS189468_7160 [Spirochaetia bacterium]|nr:hypothetical protein FACS189468_7160 [Spirochaetia bacterium]
MFAAQAPRTSITAAMQRERRFQMISGFADPEGSIALGRELGARYLIAGNITRLGERKLLVISILDSESLQMIAGDGETRSVHMGALIKMFGQGGGQAP